MANHHTAEFKNPGNYKFSQTAKGLFGFMAIVGIAIMIFGFIKDPHRAWPNFLINYFYFMGLAAAAVLFMAIQHVTNAYWSVTTRRIAEGITSYLPVALVLGVIIFLGRHHLYEWTHMSHGAGHEVITSPEMHEQHIIAMKAPYLNSKFFAIRLFGFLALWTFFAMRMRGNSIDQDANGDHKFTLSNIKMSSFFIPIFGVSFTLLSFDLLMSLEPTWFSTIFGVYCFAGIFFSCMSLLAILLIYGRRTGILNDSIVNENHLHDVGKMMFTFIVFWAYIMFSQLMLQWYANLPEETPYYIKRFSGGWWPFAIVLFLVHFIIPFFALVSRDFKRCEKHLYRMAWFMMFAQWLDVYFMVMPNFYKEGPVFGLIEVGSLLGFAGVFAITIGRSLEKAPAVPLKDPRLAECLAHTQ